MKILNRYIFKQIFVGFVLISCSLLAMLWLTQSLRFVEMVTRQGLPVYLFAEMTSLLMPRIFNVLSPIAVFVSVLFVYNRLISDRELAAMQSAGISPWQCAQGAIWLGIILTLFNVYIMNWGIPNAERNFRELEWRIKNNLNQMMFREGEFTSLRNGITVFIDKHESDGSISGIFVNDESKPNLKVTLTAEKGRLIETESGPRILFINGVRQEINKETFKFNSLVFSRYSADFNNVDSSRKKAASVREKNFWELINSADDATLAPQDVRKNIVEGHRRILAPIYNLVFALLACVGLLVGLFNRRGQMKIIATEVVLMIIINGTDLAVTNLAGRSLYWLPVLYMNCFIPLLICLYLLWFYNPFYFYRHNRKGLVKNEN
ncbi:MAG: LPS export ABC transporter permease LptF [Alphaproteobacteria bacterium]|nr:LPS export ABC transporter permease LptF [Alphaproteobacteria bacterium]